MNSELQNNQSKLNNTILIGLIFVGLIIKMFFGFRGNENNGPATSLVWGYSMVIFALLGLSFSITNSSNKSIVSIHKIMVNFMPIFLLVIGLIWLISINLEYFKSINLGEVSDVYYRYSYFTTIIILFQILIVIQYILSMGKSERELLNEIQASSYLNSDDEELKNLVNTIVNANKSYVIYVLWIFVLITHILIGMQDVSLRYFITDG